MKQVILSVIGLAVASAGALGGYLGWWESSQIVYDLGDVVDDFSLTDIYGNSVSLTDYDEAQGWAIIFTCNSCPYSLLYEDRIIDLAENYPERGVPVLVLNPNNPDVKPGDQVQKLMERADSLQFNFPYLIDDQRIYKRFGAEKTPAVYVLDRDRTLRYRGAIDDNVHNAEGVKEKYLEQVLEVLLNEEIPELRETRVIGCTIKAR